MCMKKLKILLVVLCLCAIVFSSTGYCLAQKAENANTYNIIDLVRLKKYLAGLSSDISNADYNNDNNIDSRDLVILIGYVMDETVKPDNNQNEPELDKDGYYNQVVKP